MRQNHQQTRNADGQVDESFIAGQGFDSIVRDVDYQGEKLIVVGYFNAVSGMSQLEGQAARVDTVLTDSFAIQGINTTAYPAFTAGTFVPVTVWSTLSRADTSSVTARPAIDATLTVTSTSMPRSVAAR